ncbi:hypothetical protein EZS27_029152, partial [termite gut metagenome]
TRKRREIYMYSIEDMDNDDIISDVDSTPTYQRDRATLKNIQSKTFVKRGTEEGKHVNAEGTIVF